MNEEIPEWSTEPLANSTDDVNSSSNHRTESISDKPSDIDYDKMYSLPAAKFDNYEILAAGNYAAKILSIRRSIHTPKPGGKYPRCGKIIVTFGVFSEPNKVVPCQKTFYLIDEKSALSQMFFLFKATNLLNDDGSFGNRWDDLTGSFVEVTIVDTTDSRSGKTYHNQISRIMPFVITIDDLPF